MIVRFDLEHRRETVADADGAGVLARSLQHARTFRRQFLEMDPRAFVAAVLRPHHRKDAELRLRRLAVQRSDDAIVFGAGESVPLKSRSIDVHADKLLMLGGFAPARSPYTVTRVA